MSSMTADNNQIVWRDGNRMRLPAYDMTDVIYNGALLGMARDGTVAPLGVREDDVMVGLANGHVEVVAGVPQAVNISVGGTCYGVPVTGVYWSGGVGDTQFPGLTPVYACDDNLNDLTVVPSDSCWHVGFIINVIYATNCEVLLAVGTMRVSQSEVAARNLLARWANAEWSEPMERGE